MSTTSKPAQKGIRYTDAQKKEVADFVTSYNAANGRGGQSKAAEKFKVSQLTISTWLKKAGKPAAAKKATKAAKASTAPKAAKKAAKKVSKKAGKKAARKAGKSRAGIRYSDEQKKEIIGFANAYNAENGRGGQSRAAAKYGVSPLTLMAWLKASGSPKTTTARKAGKKAGKKAARKAGRPAKAATSGAPGGLANQLNSLLSLSSLISKAEAELSSLKSKFNSLKGLLPNH